MFCISGSGSVNDNIMIITPGGGQKSGQSILRTAITELGRKAPWCKRQPCHSNIQHLASPRHRDDRCCFNQLENQHQDHFKHRQYQQKKLVDCHTQPTCFVHFDLCTCQCFITYPKKEIWKKRSRAFSCRKADEIWKVYKIPSRTQWGKQARRSLPWKQETSFANILKIIFGRKWEYVACTSSVSSLLISCSEQCLDFVKLFCSSSPSKSQPGVTNWCHISACNATQLSVGASTKVGINN